MNNIDEKKDNLESSKVDSENPNGFTVEIKSILESLYKQVEPLSDEAYSKNLEDISKWFMRKKYCLLLCKEISDYTIFNFKQGAYKDAAFVNLKACMSNRRYKIMDIIYKDEHDAFEIWVRDREDNIYMYYLFDCEDFIIEV